MATNTVERTGVVQDESTGEMFIPASRRPDGTWRKPRRVKDGYVPQEEMPVYENKGVQWLKSKPSLPPGLDPSDGSAKPQVHSSEPLSKAAKKNAKRKEKKKQQHDSNQSGTSIQNVTHSLAGVNISKDQSGAKSKTTDQSDNRITKQSAENSDKLEIAKKLKNLRKKIKQIEDLEKKIQNGELKNPEKEQLEKISKKKMILEEIDDLELDLDD